MPTKTDTSGDQDPADLTDQLYESRGPQNANLTTISATIPTHSDANIDPALVALSAGTKRGADSLFVGEDEEPQYSAEHDVKRSKLDSKDEPAFSSKLKLHDDGRLVPHKPPSVSLLSLAAFKPEFRVLERLLAETCTVLEQRFDGIVQEEGYKNADLDKARDRLRRSLMQPKYAQVKPVALVGKAGAGKSSTINALIALPGAAYESNASGRGTNVVHEFLARRSEDEQKGMFLVAAGSKSRRSISNLTLMHCENIFDHLDKDSMRPGRGDGREDEESEVEDTNDNDPLNDSESHKKFSTAIEIFTVLFGDMIHFRTKKKTEDYFRDRLEKRAEVTPALQDLALEVLDLRDIKAGEECHEAHDIRGLHDIFRRLSRVSGTAGECAHPWPLIRSVQVCFDHPLLRNGLILGDTPGIDDTNLAVVESSKDYLKGGGTVIIFEPFTRTKNNSQLVANLEEAIKHDKTANTWLAITQIDTASEMTGADRDELSPSEEIALSAAERLRDNLTQELKDLELESQRLKKLGTRRSAEESVRYMAIVDERDALLPKIAHAEAGVEQAIILMRVERVRGELTGKLREITGLKTDPELPVFFLSPKEYQKHLQGYDPNKPPKLDLEATGIPGLLRALYKVAAGDKKDTLRHACTKKLDKYLNGVTGILTKTSLERKDEVGRLLHDLLDDNDIVSRVRKDLLQRFEDNVGRVFDPQVVRSWEVRAGRLADKWTRVASTIEFVAFCRHRGNWKLAKPKDKTEMKDKREVKGNRVRSKEKREWYNWNILVTALFKDQLLGPWDSFFRGLKFVQDAMETRVMAFYGGVIGVLDDAPCFQGVQDKDIFFQVIRRVRDDTVRRLSDSFERLRHPLKIINHRCTYTSEDAYAVKLMFKVYEQCALISSANFNSQEIMDDTGGGRVKKVHERRVEILKQKMTGTGYGGSIFNGILAEATKELNDLLLTHEDAQFEQILLQGFEEIFADFDTRFAVAEDADVADQNPQAALKCREAVDEAINTVNGQMKAYVDYLDNFE